jgi:hypothetical protein
VRELWRCVDDPFANLAVAAHEVPLFLVQRPGPVQDAVGNRDLTDVMQFGRDPDSFDLRLAKPKALRGRASERCDFAEVLSEAGAAFTERFEQHIGALRPADTREVLCSYMRSSAIRSASAGEDASWGSRAIP